MIEEISLFIAFNQYEGFDDFSDEDIENLNQEALSEIGIKLYTSKK